MPRARSLIVAADGDLTVERDPDRSSGRLLHQDDMDASYVDLADARHLEFDYLRWTRLVVRAFGARRVLHIGRAYVRCPFCPPATDADRNSARSWDEEHSLS